LRDTVEAERYCRECIEVAREHRLPQWLAFAQADLGKALCSRGDPQAGITLQEEGIRSLHAAGSVLMTTRFRTYLAESFLNVGELQRARDQVEAGHAHRETYGEGFFAAELERVEAELLRAEGTPSQTVALQLEKSIRTARGQGARLFELRAATNLARLWRDGGRRAEAHALLAPIYGWFTEGFAMPDLREAKALLGELAAPT
jgi:predicted ATPase